MSDDGLPVARASDHIRLARQVSALAFQLREVEVRLASLEAAASDLRADIVAGREVDEELGLAIDRMLSKVAAGRR